MVGNHNSGRKKDPNTENYRMGKKTFYIKQKKNTKGEWVDDPNFQWFKRKHGSNWQKQLKAWMLLDVRQWKENAHWRCKCPNEGIMGNYIPKRTPQCPICDAWQNEIIRLRHC